MGLRMKTNRKIEDLLEKKTDAVRTHVLRKDLSSIPDQLAGDKFHYVQYQLDALKPFFPDNYELVLTDRYYPYAEGGALYIDEVMHDLDKRCLDQKKKIMKDLGLRYVVIKKGMSLLDALELLT